MRCVCGGPMKWSVVALDDCWLICILCGRAKPAVKETATPPVSGQTHWAVAVLDHHNTAPRPTKNMEKRSIYMSKTLGDLNEALFSQLERLAGAELKGDNLKTEIDRSRAVSNLAREIIENGKLALEAQRCLGGKKGNPKMLGVAE